MDTQPTEETVKPQRRFVVKLMQTVEVCAEQYEYDDVDNKKQALAKAQNFIDDEKDLEGAEYRLEVEEIVDEPVAPIAAPSTDETAE